jgi:dipeptidyl aminopeptidase/acylaminoacyl peptidase
MLTCFLMGCGLATDPLPDQSPSSILGTNESELPIPQVRSTTHTPSPTPNNTAVPTITETRGPTPSPDPYTGLAITNLQTRSYGGGVVEVIETMEENSQFTRYLVAYPSDGLRIFGFMNVPKEGSPFPIIIAIHGYIDPGVYNTLDYTTNYADELARNGYLVLHPNLRGYPPSDDGENLFRVGMAVDILNLIAIIKSQSGQEGPLHSADSTRIGLWGHSMGGGISTRVMTVSPDVDAVILYGAMSGDEQKNYDRIFNVFSNGERGLEELSAPAEAIKQISPINYLEDIEAAVSIHHGTNDAEVPVEWSTDLCDRLAQMNKIVECFYYADQPHTFIGEGDLLFIFRMVDFFNRHLNMDN